MQKNNYSKRLKYIISVFVILFSVHISTSQDIKSRLSGVEKITPDSTIHLSYNAVGGPLENKENVKAIAYLFNDYKWVTKNVALTKTENSWKADFYIPIECGFVAFKFLVPVEGEMPIEDNNDDLGFVYTVINGKELVPGGHLAWGIFRKLNFDYNSAGYFKEFSITNDALEYWTKKELKAYPNNFPKIFPTYLDVLKTCVPEKYPRLVLRFIEEFQSTDSIISEKNYIKMRNVFQIDLKDTLKANEIIALIYTKYPKGQTKRLEASHQLYSNLTQTDRSVLLEAFLKDFPITEWEKDKDATYQKNIYDRVITELATRYYENNQSDKFLELISNADFNVLTDISYSAVHKSYKLNTMPLKAVYLASKALVAKQIEKVNDNSYANAYRNRPWLIEEHAYNKLYENIAFHILILNAIEKYDEAKAYFERLPEDKKYTNIRVNKAYYNILKNIGTDKDQLKFLENNVKYNTISPESILHLKTFYVKNHTTEKGFDVYFNSLKDKEAQDLLKAELKKALIKVPYEAFSLSGEHRLKVKSKKFKNKIVVLDFWATWCGPCKSAFPGMQMAVNKFINDSNVDIYFISTQEFDKGFKETAKSYLKEHNYKFNLLFDENNSETNAQDKVFSKFAKIFKSSGIPRKVILKDGFIRYTSEGYTGSPSKLSDEIEIVVNLLKSEKK